MAWIYHQSTGELWHRGKLMGKGYSGSLTQKKTRIVNTLKVWGQFLAVPGILADIPVQRDHLP
ncbi:hypothetical protein ACVWYV_004359 [Pantoea eucalypti]